MLQQQTYAEEEINREIKTEIKSVIREESDSEFERSESVQQSLVDQDARQTEQDAAYMEQLMETIVTEAQKYASQRRVMRRLTIAMAIVVVLLMVVFVAKGLKTGNWDFGDFGTYTVIFSGISGVTATAKHKQAASELAQIEDIRAVGPLASSLIIDQKEVLAQVRGALIRLLPRLSATDSALLTASQRDCLNKVLTALSKKPADTQLQELGIAILKAYEQVGDETALPVVETLATDSELKLVRPEVVTAAQECLPYLQHRAEEQRNRQTLLRGSYLAEASPDTLLRPAQETTENSSELLRATNGQDTIG